MHLLCMTHNLSTPKDIADAMEALGMNQPRFADAVGVDQGTVSKWVNGKANPSAPVRKLISILLTEHASQPESAACLPPPFSEKPNRPLPRKPNGPRVHWPVMSEATR